MAFQIPALNERTVAAVVLQSFAIGLAVLHGQDGTNHLLRLISVGLLDLVCLHGSSQGFADVSNAFQSRFWKS